MRSIPENKIEDIANQFRALPTKAKRAYLGVAAKEILQGSLEDYELKIEAGLKYYLAKDGRVLAYGQSALRDLAATFKEPTVQVLLVSERVADAINQSLQKRMIPPPAHLALLPAYRQSERIPVLWREAVAKRIGDNLSRLLSAPPLEGQDPLETAIAQGIRLSEDDGLWELFMLSLSLKKELEKQKGLLATCKEELALAEKTVLLTRGEVCRVIARLEAEQQKNADLTEKLARTAASPAPADGTKAEGVETPSETSGGKPVEGSDNDEILFD